MGLAGERVRRVQHLPEMDMESLAAYGGLANALRADGKYNEAEMVYRKVLALEQRLCGAEHPSTLSTAHNVALCLRYQRKFEEAIKLHKSTLRSRRRVLGMEHRDTLGTKSDLATALERNGQLEDSSGKDVPHNFEDDEASAANERHLYFGNTEQLCFVVRRWVQ